MRKRTRFDLKKPLDVLLFWDGRNVLLRHTALTNKRHDGFIRYICDLVGNLSSEKNLRIHLLSSLKFSKDNVIIHDEISQEMLEGCRIIHIIGGPLLFKKFIKKYEPMLGNKKIIYHMLGSYFYSANEFFSLGLETLRAYPIMTAIRVMKSSFLMYLSSLISIRFLNNADQIIASCAYLRDILIRKGVDEGKIKVIYPSIKVPKKRPGKGRSGGDKLSIFHYSNNSLKGTYRIYKLAEYCLNADSPLLFTVSLSEDNRKLESRFSRLGNVKYMGRCKDLNREILRHDVVVLPYISGSTGFGVPYMALEAMVLGMPLIITDVGSHGEFITHGLDGYLLESPETPCLLEGINHYKKRSVRERSKKNVIRKVNRLFNPDSERESFIGIYGALSYEK